MKKSILNLGEKLDKTLQKQINGGFSKGKTQCDYVLCYIKRTHQWLCLTEEQCLRETN
ncbi:hypothetical protein KUL113_30550 [Tenacibaculum sp. KUL113]|nr:hypothetical protein BACY1_19430 [Tenacibaculum mesophilum]GFD73635.1 hypothetical protein KUL113_30550 [Tenacibaculum sp. KUL113]